MSAIMGSVNDFDISAMERDAFQRGDSMLAELLGRLIDAESGAGDELRDAQNSADDADLAASRAEQERDDVRAACQRFLDELEVMVNDTETKLTRSAIMSKIKEARKDLIP